MIYQVVGDDGRALDAQLQIEGHDIVYHERSGTEGPDAENVDYSIGLRLLLKRIRTGKLKLEEVWVDRRGPTR